MGASTMRYFPVIFREHELWGNLSIANLTATAMKRNADGSALLRENLFEESVIMERRELVDETRQVQSVNPKNRFDEAVIMERRELVGETRQVQSVNPQNLFDEAVIMDRHELADETRQVQSVNPQKLVIQWSQTERVSEYDVG